MKKPLEINRNIKRSAILPDVSEYQSIVDKLEILEDIKTAEEQIDLNNENLLVFFINKKIRRYF